MQEGASAWLMKLPTRLSEVAEVMAEAAVVASPDPPATAPAAWGGVAFAAAPRLSDSVEIEMGERGFADPVSSDTSADTVSSDSW